MEVKNILVCNFSHKSFRTLIQAIVNNIIPRNVPEGTWSKILSLTILMFEKLNMNAWDLRNSIVSFINNLTLSSELSMPWVVDKVIWIQATPGALGLES